MINHPIARYMANLKKNHSISIRCVLNFPMAAGLALSRLSPYKISSHSYWMNPEKAASVKGVLSLPYEMSRSRNNLVTTALGHVPPS
jgi:hypothetical protein